MLRSVAESHFFVPKKPVLDFVRREGGFVNVEGQSRLSFTKGFLPMLVHVPSLHRFDAYRLSLDFRRHVVGWLPLRRTELSDQLDRASISVPLNIAEGAGRSTPRERARSYTIARGSAVECLACLDLLELESSALNTRDARIVLVRLLDVLTALIRR